MMHKKLFIMLVGSVVTIMILYGSYHGLKSWRFNSDAPEANFAPPADLAEARAQDMTQLALFFDLEKSFTPDTLAKAKTLYSGLSEEAAGLSDAQFDLAVARIVAVADNAHSRVREYGRAPRYNRLPIRGHWFADGYYIIRAYQGFEHLLGRKVTAIEGRNFDDAAAEIRQYIAGKEGVFRKYSPYLLESPSLMHAADLAKSPNALTLSLEDFNGRTETITLTLPFPPAGDHIARSHVLLSPKVYSISQSNWSSLPLDAAEIPLYLTAPLKQLQMAEIAEMDAFYVQFWTNNDTGDISISDFCRDALRSYRASSAKILIIDHRFNGGGNFGKTASCFKDFAKAAKARGRLYVIAGGATFSAGVYSVAILKQYGGDNTILVGEDVGGRLESWGESNLLRLPNSNVEINFSTGFHNLKDGCTDWQVCHWSAMFHSLRINSLAPDLPAPLRFRDYIDGRDVALSAIQQFEINLGTR